MEQVQKQRTGSGATAVQIRTATRPELLRVDSQNHQPVYIEPRNTLHEAEARRAASRFGTDPVDSRPSPLGSGGARARLGPSLAQQLHRRLDSGGAPIPGPTRRDMERHFHRKLGGVRVHDDSTAHEIAESIDARAFAVGNDVFFGAGHYAPGDPRSDRILAHEIMHILQQDNRASGEYVIQRDDPGMIGDIDIWEPEGDDAGFSIDFSAPRPVFKMPELTLPTIEEKMKGVDRVGGIARNILITEPFEYERWDGTRQTTQRDKWNSHIGSQMNNIERYFDRFTPYMATPNDTDPVYYLKVKNTDQILIGTRSELLEREFRIPTWDKDGRQSYFDADHYREYQLRGPDEVPNLWLLEQFPNRSSGGTINAEVLRRLNELFRRAHNAGFFNTRHASKYTARHRSVPQNKLFQFTDLEPGREYAPDADIWTAPDIIAARHMRKNGTRLVRPMRLNQLQRLGLVPQEGGRSHEKVLWFLNRRGGEYREIDIRTPGVLKYKNRVLGADTSDENSNQGRNSSNDFIKNFVIQSATLDTDIDLEDLNAGDQIGGISGELRGGKGYYWDRAEKRKKYSSRVIVPGAFELPLRYEPRFGYGAYIDTSVVGTALRAAREAQAKGLSPLAISSAGISNSWAMELSASLTSTHPMFEGFEATLGLSEFGIQLDVSIPTERLDFGFFRVTEASLSIAYGNDGLLFGGAASFEVDQIGSGQITAMGTYLEGNFDFDFDFVDPARITVRYEDESWTFGGELGIKEGVVPGLQSGLINVGIDDEGALTVDGEAQVLLPGQSNPVSVTVSYSEEQGVSIGGEVEFDTSRWPAITNAHVTINANYNPEEEGWQLGGTGRADFALPGVTGTLTATYDNGSIIFLGDGDVAIGNATGEFNFAIGNYPVTEEGEFDTSVDPVEEFNAWGGGSVSIAFGEYITGTVGIRYTPDDEIVLSGGIALPPSIPLFDPLEYDRNLLTFPRLEFPIFGVSIPVVGSIGVFGFIGGRLRGYSTVGPATIDDTSADVEYTLGDPDSAVIHGDSYLNFGMNAGIELDVGGGLGLGAAVADLTGEVGITAALDFAVDAGADLDIDWTPRAGLSLDLELHGDFSPSFRIGVFGRVAASVALYGEVWSERWDETLAEFGSGLEVSVRQPATWDEENGLDLDFADAVFTYPDFDIEEIAGDIMDQLV